MKQNIRLYLIIILVIVGFSIYTLYPLQEKINLGLDLKGGLDLVFEVDSEKLVDDTIDMKASKIKELLAANGVADYSVTTDLKNNTLSVSVFDDVEKERLAEIEALVVQDDILFKDKGSIKEGLLMKVRENKIREGNTDSLNQALIVLRNRVDMFGVTEPTITISGKSRINVQLPGKNSQELAEDIGSTAVLEFKFLREENGAVESVSEKTKLGNPGSDHKVYAGQLDETTGRTPFYMVERVTQMKGDSLADARIGYDEFGKPYVSIAFKDSGAKRFAQITQNNIGRRLAIILDDRVMSAPVIQDAIPNGQAMISGNFSEQEARKLSMILKSGALPVPLKRVSEISVGPSLGKESISKGVYAASVGALLVLIYMVFMYRLSGFIADFSLIMNVILLLAGMALLKATLTLPGIAGIILTIGISVDANVIIFERIKEELRVGKTVGAAIEGGFDKAFSTILDSNVTTILTAIILYNFGTGAVKGFAVTLMLGTAINIFTAVFAVRTIFSVVTTAFNIKKLSI
jgi:preprotein translocase subunit SecD